MTNKAKADTFLQYVAANEKKLKYALRKNTTYNPDIFDDVFQNCIIKVYNSILKNGTEIEDYEKYFYMCLRFEYINTDNRERKRIANSIPDYFDDEKHHILDIPDYADDVYDEYDENDAKQRLNDLALILYSKFGKVDTDLYISYMTRKTLGNGCNYKQIANENNMTVEQISNIFKPIKHYIQYHYAND